MVANANAVASASATAAVTLSQTFEELKSCQLSTEDLTALKAAIADLEAEKGKDPETICEKASKLLDLAKKGVDIATAVAPFVASVLQTLRPGA